MIIETNFVKNHTKIAIEIFNKNAVEYQRQFMNVDFYADTLDLFCDQIKKGRAQILEVGCGPANITSYLISKRPDFKILATDLSEKMLELAKKNIPNVELRILDLKKINSLESKFNGIVCGFGIPYLSKIELVEFFKNAFNLLTENGTFYISTMEGENKESGFQKSSSGKGKFLYINYYSADYLIEILEENTFKVFDLKRKKYKDKRGNSITDLIMICKKH